MFVCIEVALHRVPIEKGIQLGLGEGPIKWVQCTNPAGTIGPASRTLAHTRSKALSVANFTLGSEGCPVSSY